MNKRKLVKGLGHLLATISWTINCTSKSFSKKTVERYIYRHTYIKGNKTLRSYIPCGHKIKLIQIKQNKKTTIKKFTTQRLKGK